ncbi:MAG: ParB/RepB/Spo0J family partition protein, partial [Planctomycetota bacterium]|nr:ParB/RepB/Spo0J family partition protein [Planctomycetota bacterium]
QPRQEFESEALAELVQSIAQHGILQPILVRMCDGAYQLIAGERRLLAARKVGLAEVPCRVVEMDDKSVCEVAIVENVQRADLNDLEKATAFQQYLDRFGGTIEELARKMGKDRSTISNCLRLLELPKEVKLALGEGKITAGHARALLPLDDEIHQVELCEQIQVQGFSVRQTEEAVREKLLAGGDTIPFTATGKGKGRNGKGSIGGAHVRDLERQLREALGVKVEISLKSKQAGKLVVHFGSNEDFERVCGFLKKAS